MKIIHLLESINPKGGGLPAAVLALAEQQHKMGYEVILATLDSLDTVHIKKSHAFIKTNLNKLKPLVDGLSGVVMFHLHGLWNIKLWLAALKFKAMGHKLILSPHGQLMPTLINADSKLKKIKKNIFLKLLLDNLIVKVDVLHGVCEAETKIFHANYPGVPCMTIHNYIDNLVWSTATTVLPEHIWEKEIVFTFIGRIDERKGVLDLVKAFKQIKTNKKIKLNVIGPVEDNLTITKIYDVISSGGRINDIQVCSPAYSNEKINAYINSAFVVLPSYSEVIGLVNIEAALLKRCVITTLNANITDIGLNGGYVIPTGQPSIVTSLLLASQLSYEEYAARCESLSAWSRSIFEPAILTKKWEELYAYTLRGHQVH